MQIWCTQIGKLINLEKNWKNKIVRKWNYSPVTWIVLHKFLCEHKQVVHYFHSIVKIICFFFAVLIYSCLVHFIDNRLHTEMTMYWYLKDTESKTQFLQPEGLQMFIDFVKLHNIWKVEKGSNGVHCTFTNKDT